MTGATVEASQRVAVQVAAEVAEIAAGPASIEQRAEALLETLRRVVPYQAARVALLDPERREHVLLAERGYDDRMRSWFTSAAAVAEVELVGLHRAAPPIRVRRDRSGPPSELRGWAEYLQPAGFRESLGVGLFALDGRHLGVLALHTDTVAHPTDAARDLIGALTPLLGHAVDPLRSIIAAARIVRGATAGVVLTRAEHPLPLPGLPTHPLLLEGSALLAVAAGMAGENGYAVFLCPTPGAGPDHVRVTVLGCAAHPPHHMVAVVVLSPPADLRGLTPVQLRILGLLVEGRTNPRIAAALRLAKRAVAAHMAQIRAQLDAPTRAVATMRAARQGVYVPSSLTGAGD